MNEMKFFISNSKKDHNQNMPNISSKSENGFIDIYSSNINCDWKKDGNQYILLGTVHGIRSDDGIINKDYTNESLQKLLERPDTVKSIEGKFIVIKLLDNKKLMLWTDYFGCYDVFIQEYKDELFISSGIDYLPVLTRKASAIDDVGLMQAVYIYGGRSAKKHTTYKNICRLGVSETLVFDEIKGLKFDKNEMTFETIRNYDESSALLDYSNIFIESINARSSKDGNIVFLSSGWDSTSILATLVHLHGNKKVRAIIGRMRYSDRSGVANSFEMDRATKIADYFGVKLDVVDLDYRRNAETLFHELESCYRSQQFTNLTGFNHWILSKEAARTSNGNEAIFAGEMSDGAHNFGFSQYMTIFHPSSYDYREYSDKMASYLFGPTFLNVLINRKHNDDPVWNQFKNIRGDSYFEAPANDVDSLKLQFLKSFFLRSGRLPLSRNTSNMITSSGKNLLDEVTSEVYLSNYVKLLNSQNLYAIYLYLYNSFHWQGSTVATLYHASNEHGMECMMPFHDISLIDFLSFMPESWGRGLEMKPTKYPLKWMLSNKIDYPMELQVGPHSYTYDVNPSFSHIGEILNHSSLGKFFRSQLKTSDYLDIYSSELFNHEYIEKLTTRYTNGEEILGEEQVDILNLSMQKILGPKLN